MGFKKNKKSEKREDSIFAQNNLSRRQPYFGIVYGSCDCFEVNSV